jgi:hypothetical protein
MKINFTMFSITYSRWAHLSIFENLKFACVLPNPKTLALWPVEYSWDSQCSQFLSSATTTFIKAEDEV